MNQIAKVCLIGDFAVGKTSLIRRFTESRFSESYLSTIGIRVSRKTLQTSDSSTLTLMIWDTAGGEPFTTVVRSYYRGSRGAALVCDVTRPETVTSLMRYAREFHTVNPGVSLIMMANKIDLRSERAVTDAQLDENCRCTRRSTVLHQRQNRRRRRRRLSGAWSIDYRERESSMTQNDTINHYPHNEHNEADQEVQEDLERVRQIILGPDPLRQRLQQAEVDRLREILFGAQIEEYERRFADLRREVQRIGNDLLENARTPWRSRKNNGARLEMLELDTRRLTDDARRESDRQRSREALMQQIATQVRQHDDQLKATGETVLDLRKMQTSQESELRSVRAGMVDVRDQIEQRAQALRREIRHTEDELRAELRRIADRLEYQKTDRKALASMLIELAARLETGSTVTDLLEGLHTSKD